MGDQIGIDPVDLEMLVQQTVDASRETYDRLPPDQQQIFRKNAADTINKTHELFEHCRRQTIDHVLLIIDEVNRIERVPPYLKETLIRFRDDKSPGVPGELAKSVKAKMAL